MSNDNYLLRVLGLAAGPRLLSFLLSLFSFPIMVKALGAEQYGAVAVITATSAMIEGFVDFGVSSAAGKNVAAAREQNAAAVGHVVKRWAQLQARVAIL